jgi:hypothetical protein
MKDGGQVSHRHAGGGHGSRLSQNTRLRLVSAQRGHILCPDKGSLHGPMWPH